MTFTKTPPTTPGFYAWRRDAQSIFEMIPTFHVVNPKHYENVGGEWCRLVPSEEVEPAWDEGARAAVNDYMIDLKKWNHSRAKRVVEGKE